MKNDFLNTLKCIENSRDAVIHKMYVSNVGNRLREMETPSDIDCQRWPWELMQNAKDSISGTNRESVEVILDISENLVTFQHDGCAFNGKTYLALLYKYSEGKTNNTESTGRFGTGFLTTHSLSKVVKMEGPIIEEDGTICRFEVTMYRDGKNNEELIEGMKRMENEKKFWKNINPRWTKFKYILKTKRNRESSELGLYNFKINIVLTMLFNKKFKKIELNSKDINLIYEKKQEQQKEEENNIEIITYSLTNVYNKVKSKSRSFLHSTINEKSKELTEHFDKIRYLTVECALEINIEEPENKKIICDERSPCLFCSLPLVGSESHILPFILNSNDFEPSIERQEILLDGVEVKKDEKRNNIEIPTDVGINRYILKKSYELFDRIVKYCSDNKFKDLHLLSRGLKDIPNVNKYFDKKWYNENYMNDMREILYKYPIIYNSNDELSLIKSVNFPIYDNYDENFTKLYYELFKELYIKDENIDIPRYEESIKWSQYLWKNGLENNRIDIHKLIHKYNKSEHSFEFNNKFIRFIWENYKQLTFKEKVLINQENNYIIYDEKEFAQSINIPEDIIDCIEELGIKWKINHLHNEINSINIPKQHNIDYAINEIKNLIENNKEKSYKLVRYVDKNNKKRKTLYNLSKLLFKEKIGEIYIVQNFKDEIYNIADKYLIGKMLETAEKWNNYSEITINKDEYNCLLNFLYENNNKLFENKKLLPSINGDFYFLKDLYQDHNINDEIKNGALKYTDIKFNDKILHPKIKINNLNIKKYCTEHLLKEINKFLQEKLDSEEKIDISKILISFSPQLESNDINDKIIKKHNDIREIYNYEYKTFLKGEILETKVNTIWDNVDKNIMKDIQTKFQEKEIINEEIKNNYIQILNNYQNYFDFDKYSLIPNFYGVLLKISQLKDYNDIPEDIIDGIKTIFFKDLKEKSTCKGIRINKITKVTIHEIGDIIHQCFKNKENNLSFKYEFTYDLLKIIIKYIPKDEERKKRQVKLYNIFKLFDKSVEDMIEIDSDDNLYIDVNKGIIENINKKINDCKNVSNTKIFIDDIFKFINENKYILYPEKYNILPNQLGELKKIDELFIDNNILEELKDIISKYSNIRNSLMDKRITEFHDLNRIKTNEDIKKEINKLIEKKNELVIKKVIKLIPKGEGNLKQKHIKFIYESLFCEEKLEEKEIELDCSFWDKANEYVLKKCISFFKENKTLTLKDIHKNEEKALSILEILYLYIPPQLEENSKLKFIPNQYGTLLKYTELNEEKDLNQTFKNMLKYLFKYDISVILKHKKLELKLIKELSINNDIIEIISKGFQEKEFTNKYDEELQRTQLIEKATEFIKFYPKNKENNYVLKFIDCYKALTKEHFKEEEINTNLIYLWNKAIEILLIKILKKIKEDKNIKGTSTRIGIDEDKTIEKLNMFYSILFDPNLGKEINKYDILPNKKGFYKKLNEIYINTDIDDEMIKILSLLNEKKSFEYILIHPKIKLTTSHSHKCLKDIALVIDKEVKNNYEEIDKMYQNEKEVKINENVKKAFQILIQKWFKEHKSQMNLFEFTKNHLVDISIKILMDKATKNILENLLIEDPETLIEIIKFQNPFAPLLWWDESIIEEDISESSFNSANETRENSMIQQNNYNFINFLYNNNNLNNNLNNNHNNNLNNNLNNNPNNNHNNNYRNQNRNLNYNIGVVLRNRYTEGVKKYCKAQAYVYEKLLESNLFNEINWKDRLNDNEDGELVILPNGHRYKIKEVASNYNFIVKTKQNKEYKIIVKSGDSSRNNYLKFNFTSSQWESFKNEEKIIFAFVSLNLTNPQIKFSKKINLEEL